MGLMDFGRRVLDPGGIFGGGQKIDPMDPANTRAVTDALQYTPEELEAMRQQQQLMEYLQAQVAGTGGPSPAEMQMRQGMQNNLFQTMAGVKSQRSMAPGAVARLGAQQQAQGNQQTAMEAAILRAREQQAAQQQLGGLLGQQFQMGGALRDPTIQANLDMAQMEQQRRALEAQMKAQQEGALVSGGSAMAGSFIGRGGGGGGNSGGGSAGGSGGYAI